MAALAWQAACPYVFCDGTPKLTAIYSDFYSADKSLFEQTHALHLRYALTLYLQPDLRWVPDVRQRDGSPVLTIIHVRVLRALKARRYPRIKVSGSGESRLQAAILAVETRTAEVSDIISTPKN